MAMAGSPPRYVRSSTTTAAGVIGIVLSSLWGLLGAFLMLAAIVVEDLFDEADNDGALEGFEDAGDVASGVFVFFGLIVLAAVAWSIIASANLLKRRRWGRVGTIVTFSIWGGLSALFLVFALAGSASDDDDFDSTSSRFDDDTESNSAGGAVIWFINAAGCVTVVALAAQRSVADDVNAAEAGMRPGFASPYGAPPPGYGAPAPGYGAPAFGSPGPPPPPPGYGGPQQGGFGGGPASPPNQGPPWASPPSQPGAPPPPPPSDDPFAPPSWP
jgi:hypothetical protein